MEHKDGTLLQTVRRILAMFMTEEAIRRMSVIAASAAVLITVLILLFKLLTHFPFFDESLQLHYLWLFSSGLRPDTDFFCIYPALGYLLTMPLMNIFPDSALVLLGMRGFTLLLGILIGFIFYWHGRRLNDDWIAGILPFLLIVKSPAMLAFFVEYNIDHIAAVLALAALSICFTMPQKRSIFIAAALAAVSCAVTPKYPLPLLFGFAGFFAAYFIRHRRIAGAVGTAVAGALCGLSLVILIYLLSGTSLEENIRHSFLLLFRWSTQSADFGFQAGNVPVAVAIVEFLIRNPVFGVFVVLGIIGWGVRSRRSPDSQALAGAGILLGVLVSSFLIKEFISQYVGPRVLCLALFVPYAFTLFKSPRINLVLRIVFVAGAIVTLVVRVDNVADKFFSTPMNVRGITKTHIRSVDSIFMAPTGILVLADYDHLLEIIPKNERVVAAWPFHPIFRRDLTVVGVDDRPTFRDILPDDDIMKRYFTPEYFLKSLEDHPPAMISISRLEDNYPPEWKETAEYFLSRHPDLYVPFRTRFFEFPVRRDLVKNLSQSSDAGSMIR